MKYPSFLKENDTIGFVAPSFGCNIEPYKTAFQHALDKFQEFGYNVELGPNCYATDGIGISSTPENCGRELEDFYASTTNRALISCGGGELMCGILDYINFDKLESADPKWYIGYSDNTNFTFLLTTILDTASIYGPSAPAFGMQPWHPAIADAWDILTGKKYSVKNYSAWERESLKTEDNPLAPYHVTEPEIFHTFIAMDGKCIETKKKITVSGRLLGGCMDCLVNLLGTTYDHVPEFVQKYQKDGILWFLESCDLNIMSIYRAIWQMQHAGWFQYVKGFLIGRPLCHGQEMFGMDQYRAVTELLAQYNVPIIMDIDLGHLPPAMPLICGSVATVTADENSVTVDMELK